MLAYLFLYLFGIFPVLFFFRFVRILAHCIVYIVLSTLLNGFRSGFHQKVCPDQALGKGTKIRAEIYSFFIWFGLHFFGLLYKKKMVIIEHWNKF